MRERERERKGEREGGRGGGGERERGRERERERGREREGEGAIERERERGCNTVVEPPCCFRAMAFVSKEGSDYKDCEGMNKGNARFQDAPSL
jgi:hypothetical protein